MKVASIVTALALLAIACTTTTTTTSTPAPDANKADGGGDGKQAGKSDAGSDEEEEEEEETPAGGCADETGQQACLQCCASEHQEGAAVYMGAVQECICDEENCAEDCADTLCAAQPKNPDSACNTCFNSKQQACGDAVATACSANQDCVAFNNCAVESGCADKP